MGGKDKVVEGKLDWKKEIEIMIEKVNISSTINQ